MTYSIDYIVPVSYTAKDNKSYINKATVLFKDCNSFIANGDACTGWNFNRCPNDDNYCQPFVKGDKLYFQYLLDVKKYFYYQIDFYNSSTGETFDYVGALTVQSGIDSVRNNYVNLIVDTGASNFDEIGCWYFVVKMFKCDYSKESEQTTLYNNCRSEAIGGGMSDAEATKYCYNEICQDYDYISTEPFCEIPCDSSLLVTGEYPNYDCNGNFYGTFTNNQASIFKLSFRVRGSVEPDGFDFEKTVVVNKTQKSQQSERFIFFTKKIPYYVTKQLAAAFNSKTLAIDGIAYQRGVKLNKNFEEGSMWIVKENLYIDCDEINFSCE